MGCSFLSGSFHSVFGMKPDGVVGGQHWIGSAESLKKVAEEAGHRGMDLALEPINRYESFLVNTAAQAARLISMIGEPNRRRSHRVLRTGRGGRGALSGLRSGPGHHRLCYVWALAGDERRFGSWSDDPSRSWIRERE
jgi:hypothetical protein